jgi:hypothetical protein
VSRSLGITDKWTGVFVRVHAPEVMEISRRRVKGPSTTIDTLEEVPGGTRYTCRITGEPAFGGPVGRADDAVLSRLLQRVLANIKSPALESDYIRYRACRFSRRLSFSQP